LNVGTKQGRIPLQQGLDEGLYSGELCIASNDPMLDPEDGMPYLVPQEDYDSKSDDSCEFETPSTILLEDDAEPGACLHEA
jgi:hypothetical protein